MTLTITINCDNEAFDRDLVTECARILQVASNNIRATGVFIETPLNDINGDKVGSIAWTDK